MLLLQYSHNEQLPEQVPPQPSEPPHWAPLQFGVQQPEPDLQVPPQPSDEPHFLPLQLGVQQPEPALQVAPQPSEAPQVLLAQAGVQQPEPGLHLPPHPSDTSHFLPWHLGVQQPEPVLQVPPQPSATPQVLPLHLGAQQVPSWQTALLDPQLTQMIPSLPHWVSLLPLTHVPLARQQPEQLAEPQVLDSRYFLVPSGSFEPPVSPGRVSPASPWSAWLSVAAEASGSGRPCVRAPGQPARSSSITGNNATRDMML